MDTAWVQVFVLTLAECVAPAGKTVCQEQQLDLAFASERDCEVALEAFLTLKDASPNVIVDRSKSRCAPSARHGTPSGPPRIPARPGGRRSGRCARPRCWR